jgi:hypothetical protein
MKKGIGIAAMLLALAACSKMENEVSPIEEPATTTDGIHIIATLSAKTAETKALNLISDGYYDYVASTWAQDEHIAILYEVNSEMMMADATIISVDGDGAATISFTVDSNTADGTPCTMVYPLSAAKEDHSGVKDNVTLLTGQDGTIKDELDVRVGEGTIGIETPGLTVTDRMRSYFCLLKLTVRKEDGTTPINVQTLTVTIGGTEQYVITPGTDTDVLYVGLPIVWYTKIVFDAKDSDDKTYTCGMAKARLDNEAYYISTLKMREYVDMGDGLKFAPCNLGAVNPQDFGDYFAWGETLPYYQEGYSQQSWSACLWREGKTGYDWASYQWSNNDGSEFSKYTTGGSVLEAADDATRRAWGSLWHIPTVEEWGQLFDTNKFSWVWSENYLSSGKKGMLVTRLTGPCAGNFIFLPAAGYRGEDKFYNNNFAYYWTSTLSSGANAPNNARYIRFYEGIDVSDVTKMTGDGWRYFGDSIRPIAE